VEKWIYQDLGSACVGEGSIYRYPFTATLEHIRLIDRLTVLRVGRLVEILIEGLWMGSGWALDGLWMGSGWALDGLWMGSGWALDDFQSRHGQAEYLSFCSNVLVLGRTFL
jgi:hypothetical protein